MKRQFVTLNLALLLLLLVFATACGGGATGSPTIEGAPMVNTDPASDNPHAPSDTGGSFMAPAAAATSTTAAAGSGYDYDLSGAMPTVAAAAPELSLKSPEGSGAGGGTTSGSSGDEAYRSSAPAAGAGGPSLEYGNPQPAMNQPPITAGKVDDNADFNTYLDYIHSYYRQDVMPIPIEQRLFLKVIDHDQHPVAGARVQLFDGQRKVFDGMTVSDGSVLFFPQAAGVSQSSKFQAVISRGQAKVEVNDIVAKDPPMEVQLKGVSDNTGPVGLDLVFLLDATGSMGDEIDRIKGTVDTIASRIEQLPGSSKPRFGLVAYRDQGDDYVTRSWEFTSDVKQFSQNLANVQAGGGGDDPESVNAGLHEAIHLPGWADNSAGRHLRMIVLVGDAPPHLDYPNDYRYPDLLKEAVANGIKIFPIGASGLNDQGEYIFRQFAEVTQGQFVFLTYANGVSGAPGVATDHHVSNFTVSDLDSLVVSLVAGEIANQTGDKSGDTSQPIVAPVESIMPIEPDAKPALASSFLASLAGVIQSWLGDAWQWLLLLWLPALLLADWVKRNRRQGDLQRAPLSSVEFELPPAPSPTIDLSREDLPEAARLAVSEGARASVPFSPTLPIDPSLYSGKASLSFSEHHLMTTLPANALPYETNEIRPTSVQSTVALCNAKVEHSTSER